MALYERYVTGTPERPETFRLKVPEHFNFAYDVVDELARIEPDRLAMLWCNQAGEERRFTFREMKDLSDRTASFFQQLGIRKGDRVMLVLKRHHEFWYCMMALHKLGAVAIPATNLLTVKDLKYRFDAADVGYIVATLDGIVAEAIDEAAGPELVKVSVRGTRPGWHSLDEGIANAAPFTPPAEPVSSEDMMLLYFTSGTSGFPKMVAHNFAYPLGHIMTAKYWQRVVDGGLHMSVADTGWGKAVWGKLYGQWLAGTTVFTYDFDGKFSAADLLAMIEKYRLTTFCAPPTIYRFMIQEDLSKYDLSSLTWAVVAGEALNPEVFEKFKAMTGLELHEGFGQTETTLSAATYPWMEPKPGSMGKPSPTYDMELVNDQGQPVEVGEVGEIVIHTDKQRPVGLFMGYYRDPNRTAQVWHDGTYHTGDVAWKDEEGYLWYVGRVDDVIKSSGYRIGPFEVESVLMEHPAVVEVAVTGVPHPVRGQVVKATIVLGAGYQPSEELKKELQTYVKKNTAPYKYPRVVEFVEHLPKTISGKIRRVEIRDQDQK